MEYKNKKDNRLANKPNSRLEKEKEAAEAQMKVEEIQLRNKIRIEEEKRYTSETHKLNKLIIEEARQRTEKEIIKKLKDEIKKLKKKII